MLWLLIVILVLTLSQCVAIYPPSHLGWPMWQLLICWAGGVAVGGSLTLVAHSPGHSGCVGGWPRLSSSLTDPQLAVRLQRCSLASRCPLSLVSRRNCELLRCCLIAGRSGEWRHQGETRQWRRSDQSESEARALDQSESGMGRRQPGRCVMSEPGRQRGCGQGLTHAICWVLVALMTRAQVWHNDPRQFSRLSSASLARHLMTWPSQCLVSFLHQPSQPRERF